MYAVCKTDIGQVRSSNQDICRCGTFSDGSAWTVVCDGMGGPAGGEVASTISVEWVSQRIVSNYTTFSSEDELLDLVRGAIEEANAEIFDRSLRDVELSGMGTTVVLALATVCACVGFLPHCSELGLTLTLLVDALSLVGLVQTLRGLQTPLPLIWRITKSFHPFT